MGNDFAAGALTVMTCNLIALGFGDQHLVRFNVALAAFVVLRNRIHARRTE